MLIRLNYAARFGFAGLSYSTSLGGLHFANLRVEGGQASYVSQVHASWINGRRVPDPEEVVPLRGANLSSLTFAHVSLQVRQINSLFMAGRRESKTYRLD